jgi:hypothetical protein
MNFFIMNVLFLLGLLTMVSCSGGINRIEELYVNNVNGSNNEEESFNLLVKADAATFISQLDYIERHRSIDFAPSKFWSTILNSSESTFDSALINSKNLIALSDFHPPDAYNETERDLFFKYSHYLLEKALKLNRPEEFFAYFWPQYSQVIISEDPSSVESIAMLIGHQFSDLSGSVNDPINVNYLYKTLRRNPDLLMSLNLLEPRPRNNFFKHYWNNLFQIYANYKNSVKANLREIFKLDATVLEDFIPITVEGVLENPEVLINFDNFPHLDSFLAIGFRQNSLSGFQLNVLLNNALNLAGSGDHLDFKNFEQTVYDRLSTSEDPKALCLSLTLDKSQIPQADFQVLFDCQWLEEVPSEDSVLAAQGLLSFYVYEDEAKVVHVYKANLEP